MLKQEDKFSRENVKQELDVIKKRIEEDKKEDALLSQQRLYRVNCNLLVAELFDSEEKLLQYIEGNQSKLENSICVSISILDFVGDFVGRQDVIRVVSSTGEFYFCTTVDDEHYAVYNKKRGQEGQPIWELEFGSMKDIYTAFRNKGIIFQNDVFAKSDSLYEQIMRGLMQDVKAKQDKQKVLGERPKL